MKQNNILVMLDEEVARLRQVRSILQDLQNFSAADYSPLDDELARLRQARMLLQNLTVTDSSPLDDEVLRLQQARAILQELTATDDAPLNDELAHLRQVRSILQTLEAGEAKVAPLIHAAEVSARSGQQRSVSEAAAEETEAAPSVVRHVSRRGIRTGRRGPRRMPQPASPRPLDAAVPQAPVVVSRAAIVAAKPIPTPEPAPAPEGTLEAWVRSLRQPVSAV